MTDFPRRIRVKGGTVIHAAQSDPRRSAHLGGVNHFVITACERRCDTSPAGHFPKPGEDTELNKAAPVSCKQCARALSAKEA